jgi:hypothetical protein
VAGAKGLGAARDWITEFFPEPLAEGTTILEQPISEARSCAL